MSIELVDHKGAVVMVPIDAQGRIHFVRQYRHATGLHLLELPAGTLESGEHPRDCAARECREEIGMSPERLTELGGCYLAPGYSSEWAQFFLAEELTAKPLSGDPDEDIVVERIMTGDALAMLLRGELNDAKTIVGLILALSHLGKLMQA